MKSKTTIAGVLAIAAALFGAVSSVLQGHAIDIGLVTSTLSAIMAGVGLIKAADATTPPTP